MSISCQGVFTPIAIAAGSGYSSHTPTDKMLEFSLSRLKESVQKTTQKNERLAFENDMLRQSILDLRKLKETLLAKKAELLGVPVAYRSRSETQFIGIVDMNAREQRTKELIDILQRDIKRLEEKIRILDDSLNEEGFHSHRKMLLERKDKSERTLREAEKQLEALKKRNMAPIGQIQALKATQNELAREAEGLQYKLNGF